MEVGKREFSLCRYKDVQMSPLVRDFNSTVEGVVVPFSPELGRHRTDDPPCDGGLALCANGRQSGSPRRATVCEAITKGEVDLSLAVSLRFSELLFEKFKVPGLMMYKDAALTCFARGRTTGMVVDMGEEFTRCCGVIDGFVSRESVSFQRLGGARLSDLYVEQCLSPFLQSQDVKTILPRGFVFRPTHNS